MVLQDVDNSSPDRFSDNPYPSSVDPYASASGSGDRFDSSSLPQPVPILGTFMGFSAGAVRFKTEATLQFAERKLGRQLYPDEAQALAFHMYQLEQTKSYFAATGAAAGTWRWHNTMAKMKYPFYQPKLEDMDKNKFAFVKGPMAQLARHTWRFSLYVLVAGQMGNMIGQVIAQPLAAVKTSQDPKLAQFGIELKAASHADGQRAAEQGRESEDRRKEFQEQVKNRSGGGPSPQARWGRQPSPQTEDAGDDMSPTAGNAAWGSQSPAAEPWETFSNDTAQPAPQRQHNPPSADNWNRQPRPSAPPQPSSLPFDDDASPTGGMFQDEVSNPPSQPQPQPQLQLRPGESTWDRLRRGGAPIPMERTPQTPSRRAEPERREQRDAATLGDPCTFAEGDGERQRERARAQQEFDARLERERQGRDFGGEDGKKW